MFTFSCNWRDKIMDLIFYGVNAGSCYILWIFLHFAATQLYVKYCVGTTFLDMIYSVLYVPSPHCQGLSWVIFHGSRNISAMWFILGTYTSSILIQNIWYHASKKEMK